MPTSATDTSDWDLQPGQHMTRAERMDRYGGNPQGGICPSADYPHVFVYSDPAKGEAYGYDYDGWDGEIFLYTGEGQEGDQVIASIGNRAILNHRENGKSLRLFVADGTVPGTSTVNQLYVGEFETVPEEPYVVEEAPDKNGELRSVLVFRLRPRGPGHKREQDRSSVRDIPDEPEARKVPAEVHDVPEYEVPASEPTTAMRRESDLVKRFEAYLLGRGHEVHRWAIRPSGAIRTLYTDTYDATDHQLYEAKGSTRRDAVRLAIGQLLDYQRYIKPRRPGLAVLLPDRPADDLVDLLRTLHFTLVYEVTQGDFETIAP